MEADRLGDLFLDDDIEIPENIYLEALEKLNFSLSLALEAAEARFSSPIGHGDILLSLTKTEYLEDLSLCRQIVEFGNIKLKKNIFENNTFFIERCANLDRLVEGFAPNIINENELHADLLKQAAQFKRACNVD